ncbi:MAG: hypothetical protein COS37_01870, partial [Anaerolineae bacterium CG03_land_8_20_14_0_80_58_20]
MLWRTFQRMGAPDGMTEGAGLLRRWMWALDGFAKSLAGSPLPGPGEWYWLPSRVIPAPGDVEPITEFPLFTFLYSDLHAHMIVLMLALFVIAWGLSFVLAMRNAGKQVDTYTGRQVDTYTGRQVDTYTGRQVDTYTGRQVDTYTRTQVDTEHGTRNHALSEVEGTQHREASLWDGTPNSQLASPNPRLASPNPQHATLITDYWSLITFPIVFGALVLGALYPTNTWDAFTYMPLAAIAVAYALFNAFPVGGWKPLLRVQSQPTLTKAGQPTEVGFANVGATLVARLTFSLAGALTLLALARIFYQPYFYWFGSGYGQIDAWRGGHTPLSSYFTHWGVFLFLIFAWMVWETREWMASTPLSSLTKLKPYQLIVELSLAAFFVTLIYLLYRGAVISLIALPMAVWAALLILRPGQSDAKRWVLFMVGTSLVLTIAVEVVVLVGDIGRMNTVFKLYLQAWTMLAVSAAAALGWTLPAVPRWRTRWRGIWQVGLTLLLAGAAFFTVTGTLDKIRDRMNSEVPHTLDSMTYMETSTFWDSVDMRLGQDYRAIRWMQDNAQGSPVI